MQNMQQVNNNFIPYEFFKKTLMKIIKALKSERICICPDCIIGTNAEISQVSIAENICTYVPEGYILELSYDQIYKLDKEELNENSNVFNELYIRSKKYGIHEMIECYNRFQNAIMIRNNIPDIFVEDVKSIVQFNDIMSRKAEEGAWAFKISDDEIIYIYKQLIPLNKPDKISLKVFKQGNGYMVAEFIIDKKYAVIKRYIYYLSLNI